jgi:outer membrane biosynthesis protein TonB
MSRFRSSAPVLLPVLFTGAVAVLVMLLRRGKRPPEVFVPVHRPALPEVDAPVASVPEPEPEFQAEPEPEPVIEFQPEPVAEFQPEPVIEFQPEPVAEFQPEPVAELVPEPEPQPDPMPEPERPADLWRMPQALPPADWSDGTQFGDRRSA